MIRELADDLKKWLATQASNVSTAVRNAPQIAQQAVSKTINTPIRNLGGGAIPGLSPVASFTPKQVGSTVLDFTVRPIARIGAESAMTIGGQKTPVIPKTSFRNPGIAEILYGDQPLRSYNDPERPGRQFAKTIGAPKAAPFLIGAGAAIDLVPGVGATGEKAGVKGLLKIADLKDISKAKSFLVSLINKAKSQEEAGEAINRVVNLAIKKKDPEIAKNLQTAINSQLIRFKNQANNPNASRFLTQLNMGFQKLNKVIDTENPVVKLTNDVKQSVETTAKNSFAEFDALQKSKTPGIKSLITTVGKNIKENTKSGLFKMADELQDIAPWRGQHSDVFRNFEKAFGKNYSRAKEMLLDPFDKSKSQYVDDYRAWRQDLEDNVVKKLGIKDKTKESALIQMFGEKKITLQELQAQAPKNWQKIVEADQWFRNKYNELLTLVNQSRAKIYPNNPDKQIPMREDYYRHFQEMAKGFEGLKNIFDSPAGISSSLSGISEFVKPKSKWASFMQARTGDKTTYDAVGGFLEYIKAASYSKNIDPQISKFRSLGEELAGATETGENAGKLNNFIEFLNDFANDLSGKTNPADRWLQKNLGRKTMKVIDWANNRFKANAVLGNLSSSMNQVLSTPLGIADAGPKNAALGLFDTLAGIFRKTTPQDKSIFLKERYFQPEDSFNVGLLDKPKDFAKWMLTVVDQNATKFIWNAQYRRFSNQAKTEEEAARLADYATRKIVGGRGIGEVPLAQKARIVQLAAPFQLEVANQWLVMKEWMDQKSFGKFVTLMLSGYFLNNAIEKATGNRPGFDPIEAVTDGATAWEEEDDNVEGAKKFAGRLTGELLSNLPYVQSLLSGLPDQGDLPGIGLTKKEFFGEQDPTRFGTGIPLARTFSGRPEDLIFGIVTPYAGAQLKKVFKGSQALKDNGVYNDKGELKYPVGQELSDKLQNLVFGPASTPMAQFYFDNGLNVLSRVESLLWAQAVEKGADPILGWLALQKHKVDKGLAPAIQRVISDLSMDVSEKQKRLKELINDREVLIRKINNYMNDVKEVPNTVSADDAPTSEVKFQPGYEPGGEFSNKGGTGKTKKGKKPAYPTMPKLKLTNVLKESKTDAYSVKPENDNIDINKLLELGKLPDLDLKL